VRAAHNRAYSAQIDVPAPFRDVMGVADVVSKLRPFAAHFTYPCHLLLQNSIDAVWLDAANPLVLGFFRNQPQPRAEGALEGSDEDVQSTDCNGNRRPLAIHREGLDFAYECDAHIFCSTSGGSEPEALGRAREELAGGEIRAAHL
jgi:hypothetical protein